MATISRQDIEGVAKKLDGLDLSATERDIMTTVFALAAVELGTAEAAIDTDAGGGDAKEIVKAQGDVPLSTIFATAFLPGEAGRFDIRRPGPGGGGPVEEVSVEVKGGWSK